MKTNRLPLLLMILIISTITTVAQTARVQVIHNSPDAAASEVDVWLNNTKLIDDFAFRTASSFIDAPAGSEITIGIAPGNTTTINDTLKAWNFTLTENETYILVANGIVSGTGYAPSPELNLDVYAIGREMAMTSGNTDVLVYHGSTDAPTVDVVEVGAGAGTIVDNLSYAGFSSYLELGTADYILNVRDETGKVTVASYDAPLATLGLEDSSIVVVASGFLNPANNSNGEAFGLFAVLPEGGAFVALPAASQETARAQVIHNSADAAASEVDVYIDGTLTFDDFEFRTASQFVDLPAQVSINVAIAPGTSTSVDDAIATFTYTLQPDETYILVANGIVSATGYTPATAFNLDVYAMGREMATTSGKTDVLVYHGSTDAPTVDVVEVGAGAGTIVDNLSYAGFSSYLELGTADYILNVRDETGKVTVASYDAPLATLGLEDSSIVVVASGFLNPANNSSGEAFGLFAVLPEGGAFVALPAAEGKTAMAQIIHNSADPAIETVDVYLDGSLTFNDFNFRQASGFVDLPANVSINVDFAPANSSSVDESIASFNYTLKPEMNYVLVANGMVSSTGFATYEAFGIDVYDMGRDTASTAGNTDVIVYHGATDAPTVDVVETGVGAGTIVDDLSYGEFSSYLELATADYMLEVRDATGTTTVKKYNAPLETLGLQDSAIVVLASGFLSPEDDNNGPEFGLFAALASGGDLIALPTPMARVQVIHNSADMAADSVDIYLNNDLLLDNFAFRNASPFIDAPAEDTISIAVAPKTSTSSADAIATFKYKLADGETYILIANGIVSAEGYDPATAFDINVYAMGREMAMTTGNTDVLVYHGSTDAPTVDVVEVGVGAGTIVDNLAYSEFAGYLELATADYILNVRDESGTVTVASFDAPLATLGLEDASLVVVASGFLNPANNSDGAAFGLYVALPAGGELIALPAASMETARVQVIHNSADAAAEMVDVYLDGSLLIDDFTFRTASAFIDAPAQVSINIDIAPSTSMSADESIAQFTYTLDPMKSYILVANGIVSETGYDPATSFSIDVFDMAREEASMMGNTDVLVYHGSTDAPIVDVVETGIGAGTIVDNLSYADFAGYLELGNEDYTLEIRDETGETTVASFNAPLNTLGLADSALIVIASGFLNPVNNSNGEAFGLYVALPSGGDLIALPTPTTNINEIEKELLVSSIYPNPAIDNVNINFEMKNNSEIHINIYNVLGSELYSKTLLAYEGNNNFQIVLNEFKNGLYYLTISSKNQIVKTHKLQIKN
jgi:Domain of unknown function (DUF4397)/Secretion system C-terminal sorting domain